MKFKEVAEAKSGGRLKIEVYPAGQLAKNGTVMLEGMQLGTVDIGANDTPTIGAKWDAKFLMPDVPFLWQSREQLWKVVDGPIGKELIKRLEPLGAQGLLLRRRLGLPEHPVQQAPGLHARPTSRGRPSASPVPTLVELDEGLRRQPCADAVGRGVSRHEAGDDRRPRAARGHGDVRQVPRDHQVLLDHAPRLSARPLDAWPARKYAALPDDLKKVIDESMLTACAQHRQDELKQEVEAFALMRAKGVQINEVKDIREFQERAAPVWKFLEAKVGKEFFDRAVAEARAAAK